MPSPGYVAHEHRLFDGRTVTIRPIRPDDADRMRRFLAAASEDARYKRFHKWVAAPSEDLVHFLTDIDHVRHLAFVCTVEAEDGERIVGEARSIAYPDGKHCEFGVLVEDAWRRTGVAGLLMDDLIRAAAERGFTTMDGVVLRTNRAMQRFARSLGFEVVPMSGDLRTLRIRLDLARRQPRAEAGAAPAAPRP